MKKLVTRLRREDKGMSTVEYAIGTVAAAAFAAVLYKIVTSGTVVQALTKIVTSALTMNL
jgi:Flp pilus assembly pilin Flp